MKKLHKKKPKNTKFPTKKATLDQRSTSIPVPHCCTILESIDEGVFTIDLDKIITYFNPAAEVITGFRADETLGQFCFDLFPAIFVNWKISSNMLLFIPKNLVLRARSEFFGSAWKIPARV